MCLLEKRYKVGILNKGLFVFKFSIIFFVSFISCRRDSSPIPDEFLVVPAFVRAADLSFLPEMRQAGVKFKNRDGQLEDPLKTLATNGMNMIRLRVWHRADGKYSLRDTEKLASEARQFHLPVWVSLHYSDTWADPGAQIKPSSWQDLDFNLLKDSVYHYTYRVASTLKPSILQIGNEINSGFLWPDGHILHHDQMIALLAEGIRGCRDASPQTKIMLHYAGLSGSSVFFDASSTLDYDFTGLSYYPIWHGKSLAETGAVIQRLKNTFKKEVLIAETSYPFTLDWADYTNNILGLNTQIIPSYPATPEGQLSFLQALGQTIGQSGGRGWCYWGAEWVAAYGPHSTHGSSWENQALWDFGFQALPAIVNFGSTEEYFSEN